MGNPYAQFQRPGNVHGQGKPGGGGAVSAAPIVIPTEPPNQANLIHWFDFSDPTTVFSDAGGITPAIDAGPIRNISNKGTDGTPLDVTVGGNEPTYRVAGVNGLNYAEFIGTAIGIEAVMAVGHATIANGGTVACIGRRRGVNPVNDTFFTWGARHNIQFATSGQGPHEGRSRVGDSGAFVVTVSPTMIDNNWYLQYASADPAGVDDAYGSPGPEFTYSATLNTDVAASTLFTMGGAILGRFFDLAEVFFWNGPLSTPDRSNFVLYADNRYGDMPHA